MTAFADAVVAGDAAALASTLHPDVTFSSPAVFRPYEGRDATMGVLRAVMTVFEDFRYTAVYESADGHVLRFSARVGDKDLEGVDILRIDESGLVTELTVMIRPHHALTEVIAAMRAAMEAQS